MAEFRELNQYVCFDEQLLSEDPRHCCDIAHWKRNEKIIGHAHGRGVSWFLRGERLDMVLRHYYRGGLFRRLVRDSYWYTGYLTARSIVEFSLLQHLHKAGVAVPRPVAAQVLRYGGLYRADILLEKIPDACDLASLLQQQVLPESAWYKIGQVVRQMHDAGVCHTDLNARNILLDKQYNVWLIDFDKCFFGPDKVWKQSNLDRLMRSLHKELQHARIFFDKAGWEVLLHGYQSSMLKIAQR